MAFAGSMDTETQNTYVRLAPRPDESHKSALISLVGACKRVGRFFDLWHEDPEQLIRALEKTWENRYERHALGLLFEPCLPTVGEPDDTEEREGGGLNQGETIGHIKERKQLFEKGDLVKAKLSDDMRKQDNAGEMYIDNTRVWYHAEVVSENDDGTYNIEWEHKYDGDKVKKKEDLTHIFVSDEMDGVRTLLRNCRSSNITLAEVPIFIMLFVFIACLPELIFMFTTRRNVCSVYAEKHEDSRMKDFCRAAHDSRVLGPVVDHTFGMLLGAGCILGVQIIAYIIFPLCYHITACFSETRAKRLRRMVVLIVDAVHQGLYPQVYGAPRIRLIATLGLSYFIACVSLAVLLIAPGVLPLGAFTTQLALRIMNWALGDEVGMKEMQEARILALLTKLMKRCEIDMPEDDLRFEMDKLLRTPRNCGTMQISLGFVTLIASALESHHNDSARVHQFLISRAFAAFTHPPKQLARLKARQDIIVDVFTESCQVPGLNLLGERWAEKGAKLPWHLCIDRQVIQHFEEEINGLQTIPGDGCFTWRSPRNGLWRTRENHHPQFRINGAKKLIKQQYRIDATLNDLVHDSGFTDKPKLTFALLKANANPNFRTDVNSMKSSTFMRACMAGKLESVKLLVAYKADIGNEACEMIKTLETPHFKNIEADVLKLLEASNNPVTYRSRNESSKSSRPSVGPEPSAGIALVDDDEQIKPESREDSEVEDLENAQIKSKYRISQRTSIGTTIAQKYGAASAKDFILPTQMSIIDFSPQATKGKNNPKLYSSRSK